MSAEDHNGERSPAVNTTKVDHSLDDLAKGLANGDVSRRKALRLIGGALLGGVWASIPGVALAQQGENSACAQFCIQAFPPGPERGQCIRQGAQGEGPCHRFGCCVCSESTNPDLPGQSGCSPNVTSQEQCCDVCRSAPPAYRQCSFVSGPTPFTCESAPGPVGLECRPT
jgi:hypothetical protein